MIIILEAGKIFKERKIRFFNSMIAIACILAISLWFIFIFIFGEGLGYIAKHNTWIKVPNTKLFAFYPGHLTMLLMYLGGMFPFLVFSFKKRVSLKFFLVASLVVVPLALYFLPPGGKYVLSFHSQFLKAIDLFVQKVNLPTAAIRYFVIPLILLGLYNLMNILYSSEKNIPFYFSVGVLMLYVFAISVNSYISSRLLVPGMLGLLFLIVKIFEQKPTMLNFQMLYQVFLTAFWLGILYHTDKFLRV
jgi:hypothetical protein